MNYTNESKITEVEVSALLNRTRKYPKYNKERFAYILTNRLKGKTLVEIGKEVGVSSNRVRQNESKAVAIIEACYRGKYAEEIP